MKKYDRLVRSDMPGGPVIWRRMEEYFLFYGFLSVFSGFPGFWAVYWG